MKNILVITFIFLLGILKCQNLVPNNSFELNESLFPNAPTNASQLERTQDWKKFESSDLISQEDGYHNSYYQPNGVSVGGSTPNRMTAKTGTKFIGFGSCEGAQVKLTTKILKRRWVIFSCWYATRGLCNTKINAYLLKNKASINALINCNSPSITYQIKYEIDIPQTNVPGTWYFYQSKPMYVTDDEYEWLAIKGEDINGAFGSDKYAYIDEVKIESKEKLCDLVCSPSLGNITHTPFANVLYATGNPWKFLVTNAIGIEFKVINTNLSGPSIYEQYALDVNGLVDVG